MSIKKLNPYIHFNGTAEKAIKLYESALGAKADHVMRYGDMPGTDTPPERKNLVMHSHLRVGEGEIMLSDTTPDQPVATGGNVQIVLDFAGVEEMTKAFDALSEGGKVTLPLQDTFWGAKFGLLTDAYGVNWMFNCELKKAGS
jgi:PhnB protein